MQHHPLYIYRSLFKDQRPEPPTVLISRYGNSLVANQRSCPAVLLIGCQTPQKAVFHIIDTRGYLILGCEMVQQIGYICFSKIIPPKLRYPPKTHIPEGHGSKSTKADEDK